MPTGTISRQQLKGVDLLERAESGEKGNQIKGREEKKCDESETAGTGSGLYIAMKYGLQVKEKKTVWGAP